MHVVLAGVSHKTAPVELRERLAVTEGADGDGVREVLSRLRESVSLAECAVIATCNRTEVYGFTDAAEWQTELLGFLAQHAGLSPARLQHHIYSFAGPPAARHLFRVACGLDSMVLGEAQIQAQVKEGLQRAQESAAAGKVIDALFRAALTTGKRAREETEITRGAVSVSLAAVELARQIFGRLNGHTALVLGAGEMGEQTAKLLVDAGVDSRLLVCNRTRERAETLAQQYGGTAYGFDELPEALSRADIVISSTGSPHPVLHRDAVRQAMQRRRGRPIFLVDIAVPRDIEPEVGDLDDVFLYDIDDLNGVVDKNLAVRQSEVERVEAIVEEELARFQIWLQSLAVAPVIGDLQRKLETIGQAELERLGGKLSHLSDRDREVVETLVRGVVNKILREPILHLREAVASGNGHDSVTVLRAAFGLEADPEAPRGGGGPVRSTRGGGRPGGRPIDIASTDRHRPALAARPGTGGDPGVDRSTSPRPIDIDPAAETERP
jgi:glutamyl-tRNA reductase